MSHADSLSSAVCEQARLSRDARFDGLFFTAVTSTGIYCRPVCPAPPPRPENVRYFPSAAAAEANGFRPCLRCRPELSPAEARCGRGDDLLARALRLMDSGDLAERPVAQLAQQLGLGERQLRRLFVDRLGAAPAGVLGTRRLLFAKQLLTETVLPVTEVALASGFGSLRRFNAAFRDAYGLPPSHLRQHPGSRPGAALSLRLGYRPPFDVPAMLDFLRGRALQGLERVDGDGYARLIGTPDAPAWVRVSAWSGGVPAVRLEVDGVPAASLQALVARVRRQFDLDADPAQIQSVLGRDPLLARLLAQRPGLRIPSGWDGFEIAVRAVLGQQVSVAAARTLANRLVLAHGQRLPQRIGPGLDQFFPTPDALADADLVAIGLTRSRAETIRTLARALLDGRVDFAAGNTLGAFLERWTALAGIGDWTAHYLALRALGHPDAFPSGDLVLRKMAGSDGVAMPARQLAARAEAWRPWRGYAVIHLWREAAERSAHGTAA